MIIGFDIHGVLDTHTEQIVKMTKGLRQLGIEIMVITGPEEEQAKAELDRLGLQLGVHYDSIVSVVDWLQRHLAEGEMWQDEKGHWWCSDEDWWTSKAKICSEYDVDTLFDDSEKYLLGWDKTNCKTEFMLVHKDGEVERVR